MIRRIIKGVRKMARDVVKDQAEIVETKKRCFMEIIGDEDGLYFFGVVSIGLSLGIGVIGIGFLLRAFSKEKKDGFGEQVSV